MAQAPLIAYSSQLSIDRTWSQRVCAGFLILAISTLITIALNSIWEIPYWIYITTGTFGGFILPYSAVAPVLLLSELIDWIGTVTGVWLVSSRILAKTEQRSTLIIWMLRTAAIAYQTWRIWWRAYVFVFHGSFDGWHWTMLSTMMAIVVFTLFYLVARRVLEFCGLRRLCQELLLITSGMLLLSILSPAASWFATTFFSRAATSPRSGMQWLIIFIHMLSIGFQIWVTVFFFRARIAIRRAAPGQAK